MSRIYIGYLFREIKYYTGIYRKYSSVGGVFYAGELYFLKLMKKQTLSSVLEKISRRMSNENL